MPIAIPPPPVTLGEGSSAKILHGSGDSVPAGVDGVITYNGLVLNNRDWLDTIVITKISGLGDADLRDDREVNPQEHGETPFDAFYGGRTVTLEGFIRAFTLDKLRDLVQATRSAFKPLVESPMVFHGKTFDTTVQLFCRKYAPLVIEEEQTRDDQFRRTLMITVRASKPDFVSLDNPLVAQTFGATDDFLQDRSEDYAEL